MQAEGAGGRGEGQQGEEELRSSLVFYIADLQVRQSQLRPDAGGEDLLVDIGNKRTAQVLLELGRRLEACELDQQAELTRLASVKHGTH